MTVKPDPMRDVILAALERLVPVETEVVVWAGLPPISDVEKNPAIRVVARVEGHYYLSPASWGVRVEEPDKAGRVKVGNNGMVGYQTLYDLNRWLYQKAEIKSDPIAKEAQPAPIPPAWYMVIDVETCGLLMFQDSLDPIFEEYQNCEFFCIVRGAIDYRHAISRNHAESWMGGGTALFVRPKSGKGFVIVEVPDEVAVYGIRGENDALMSLASLIKTLNSRGCDVVRVEAGVVPLGIGIAELLRTNEATFTQVPDGRFSPLVLRVLAYNHTSRRGLTDPYADIYELEQFDKRKEAVTA